MMTCTTSIVWSHPILSLYCPESGPSHGAVLSGRITTIAMSRSGQLSLRCTIPACTSTGVSVTHEHGLKICEPSYVPRAHKHFFISVAHCLSGVVGHVAALELPSQESRAPSSGTRGSTRAPLLGRQSPEPCDTWQRRSSPQQGGEVRGRGSHGGS
jgi:hypothetical protein